MVARVEERSRLEVAHRGEWDLEERRGRGVNEGPVDGVTVMDERERTRLSKYLSYVLRHRPDTIGITLDPQGWVEIDALIRATVAGGTELDLSRLLEVVATNSKKRFALSSDGLRIRANQGHSVEIELGYDESAPPEVLFHGTVERVVQSIVADGLLKMRRHHVHLSADLETARAVGRRRGRPVVLRIAAARMARDGFTFYLSENGVWLTDRVPPEYISRT